MSSKNCTYDPINKIWSGEARPSIYNPEINLGYLLLQKLIQNPRNVGIICDDTGVKQTNAEIYERSIKFAQNFKSQGLKEGDIVGLIASNSENLMPIVIACFVLNVAVNPLSVVMDEDDIQNMWSKLKPKVIFSDGNIVGKVKMAIDQINLGAKIYTLMEKVDEFPFANDLLDIDFDVKKFKFPNLRSTPSTIALISCSSGTTSSPKGICKSHTQFISHAFLLWDRDYKVDDVIFNSIPPYWTVSILLSVHSIFYDIPSVITAKPIQTDMWMDIVEKHKVTFVFSSPRFGAMLINSKNVRKLPSIRYIVMGGSAFTESVAHRFEKVFPSGKVLAGYGTTEGDSLAISGCDEGTIGLSSGYLAYNVHSKIIDGEGNAIGPNEVGEIYIKTHVPFLGYFGDPIAYAESFDPDGFYKTGDLGYFDEEGRIYILDRIKHMIKSVGSHKVTPGEVEMYINEIPGVIQSCVVGAFDEELFYDRICAFIIKDESKKELTEEFIKSYVNNRVIDEKKISGGVYFIDKFPTTVSGKVLIRELKKMAVENIKSRKVVTN